MRLDARSLILPRLMLVEDVATALGVTVDTARGYIRRGTIPACRIGRRYVVSREQLVELVERGGSDRCADLRVVEGDGNG